jgi:fatty-acyl-CoA synthase
MSVRSTNKNDAPGVRMRTTMMQVPLSLNAFLERAGHLFGNSQIVSRLPDKQLRHHSFSQWHRRTRSLGSALQRMGLRKGDPVATLCWNHHAHLEAFFGIPAAGGVMHTLNLRLPPQEIAWIAQHAADRFLIVDDVLLPLYRQVSQHYRFESVLVVPLTGAAVAAEFTDYEAALRDADPDAFVYAPHDENDPVALCYTSGTTGRPKGVAYSHRSTILHALSTGLADLCAMRSADTVLPVVPMFHANAWGAPYGAVMVGAKLLFPGPHLHPEDLLDLMQLEPPTLAMGVPTIWLGLIQAYERALQEQPGRWKLPAGMRSMVGGSAVPESLIRAFARHGVRIQQGWGMTETSPVCTQSYLPAALAGVSEDERFRRAAMAGVPLPLVDVRLRTEDGTEPPHDGQAMGEIQVRGPFVTGSYHENGSPPDKFTDDGWLRTGDVGTMDEQGFVRITDRTKDLVKCGGEWVSSVHLENLLMAHPSVAEAAVIAVPDPKWCERPLACVVLKPGCRCEPEALREHLAREGVAKWQLPVRYEFVEAIPRTSTGKFWKVRLREQFPA